MPLVRHYIIDDTTRPLSAREAGAQSMAEQPQRWRRRPVNDWLLEHGDVMAALVAAAGLVVVLVLQVA